MHGMDPGRDHKLENKIAGFLRCERKADRPPLLSACWLRLEYGFIEKLILFVHQLPVELEFSLGSLPLIDLPSQFDLVDFPFMSQVKVNIAIRPT
jgi:hypothetical protein